MDNNLTIEECIKILEGYAKEPEKGLPEDLFLYATTITPMINVDLLVRNKQGHILMSWRDDICGKGWHIPGGIIRYKEKIHDRIIIVGQKELHTVVSHSDEPIAINEIIIEPKIRGHFISLLYKCDVPEDYDIEHQTIKEGEAGYLKWISSYPENIVVGQRDIYKNLWEQLNYEKMQMLQ